MITSLISAIETAIETKLFPINAPESYPLPYITYENNNTREYKAITGWTGLMEQIIEFNVFTKTYDELRTLSDALKLSLKTIEQTSTGVYIQEVTFEQSEVELEEKEIKAKRKVITVTISFKEEI